MGGLIFNLKGFADTFKGDRKNDFIVLRNDFPLTQQVSKVAPDRKLRKEVSLGEDKLWEKGFSDN